MAIIGIQNEKNKNYKICNSNPKNKVLTYKSNKIHARTLCGNNKILMK